MGRRRLELRHYARMYLGVKRLPAGVPLRLDSLLLNSTLPIPLQAIAQTLAPYRKPPLLP